MHDSNPDQKLTIQISTGTLVKVAVFVACIYFAITLRGLILVLISAVVIASVIEPGTRWLTKRGIQRPFSATIMYVGIAAILAGIVAFVIPPLFSETSSAINGLPKYIKTIDIFNPVTNKETYSSVKTFFPDIPSTVAVGDLAGYLASSISEFSGGLFDTVTGFFGGVVSIVLVIVISFYLSVRDDGVGEFLSIITPIRYERYVKSLWQRSQNKIGKWMQGQLLLGVFVGIMVYISLLIAGVPHSFLLGFLAAVFELIPIVGTTISAIPAFILALLDGGFGLGLIVIAIYVCIQQIESHIIYPLVAKKVIGIPPLLVIIALVAGAELAGIVGALLAVPVSVVLMELVEDIEKHKRFTPTEPNTNE
jgi:predicted PurR-regulated permease PerM